MTYAHADSDISKLLKVYDEVFAMIKEILTKRNLQKVKAAIICEICG